MNDASNSILTEAQVAQALGILPRTVRLWRKTRGLPYLRLTGKVVRFRRSDLDRWLSEHSVAITG